MDCIPDDINSDPGFDREKVSEGCGWSGERKRQ
jgi:hypothetical protein